MRFIDVLGLSTAVITGVAALPAGTSTATAPIATETLGWAQHWIRTPDHKYLQAAVPWTATDAVLGSGTSAGEYNIVSTSLVQTVHTPNFLYATVELQTEGATKLKVSFANGDVAPASAGVFAWSGSEMNLSWSRDGDTNTGWLTCADNVLYVNLAASTPSGCTTVSIASAQTEFAT